MTHDPTFWLLARASGLTAYLLLTASLLAGLVLKSRPFRLAPPALAIFAVATAPGLAAGTDSARPWAFALYLAAIGSVAAATAWRALAAPTTRRRTA